MSGRGRGRSLHGWAALGGGLLAAAVLGCAGGEEAAEAGGGEAAMADGGPPDTVRIAAPGLHPEGIEWDVERGRFLVGSVTRGTVNAVADDGDLEVFAEPVEGGGRPLQRRGGVPGSIGIHIDGERDRLLAAYADVGVFGDPENRGMARLGIYVRSTGARVDVVDLGALRPGARHFANDVTVGSDGTVYVTDSFDPVIYAVSPEGEASVLVEDERLSAEGVGLNGIDFHPDGFLLVAVMGRDALVRVPLASPSDLAEVELPEPIAGDGLVLAPDGTLVVVGSTGAAGDRRSEVVWLASRDGWASAEIVARAPSGGATTGTLREGAVYVVHPHFEAMGASEPHPSFEIYRVEPASGAAGEEP